MKIIPNITFNNVKFRLPGGKIIYHINITKDNYYIITYTDNYGRNEIVYDYNKDEIRGYFDTGKWIRI